MHDQHLIRLLARHVVAMQFDRLQRVEVDRTKQCILDCLGNMLAGRYSEKAAGLLLHAGSDDAADGATVFGLRKVAYEKAAFCNAAFSRVMDLDDGHRRAMGHPGVVIIPAVLALGEVLGSSTAEAICAIVSAYDVYVEIGTTINPSSYTVKGFDTTGVAGTVAVAAAAAKLKRLDMERIKHAMAIAALHSGGFIEYLSDGSSGKLLCPGWTVATGLRSVEMAQCGFTGPDTVLEGRHGLFRCFSDRFDASRFGLGLESARHIMSTYFKLHACLRRLHPALDGLLSARKSYALSPENVRRIVVRAGQFVMKADGRRPTTLVAAQGSMPFTLAVALKYGKVSQETLLAAMADPDVEAIEERIGLEYSATISARQEVDASLWGEAELTIETVDGRTFTEHTPFAAGEPETPLSWDDLRQKFADQLLRTPIADRTAAIESAVSRFLEFDRVDDFVRAVAASSGGRFHAPSSGCSSSMPR